MRYALAAALLLGTQIASADPQTGLWWNPAESGRGYAIDVQGETAVILTYGYDSAGRMQWYYSDARLQGGAKHFSGSLMRFDNGQPLGGAYVSPTLMGSAGAFSIDFTSHATGTLTLPGGRSVPIQRYNFGVGSAPGSLLGDWVFAYSVGSREYTYAQRFNYTVIGNRTEYGNGVVVDVSHPGGAEYQTSGELAGQVVAVHMNTSGDLLDGYYFQQQLEEGRGAWISVTTGYEYPLNAYRIASPGGTSKAAPGGPDVKGKEADARAGMTIAEVALTRPEIAAVAREVFHTVQTELAKAGGAR